MSVLLSQKLWLLVAKRRGKNTLQKTTFLVAAAPSKTQDVWVSGIEVAQKQKVLLVLTHLGL